MSLKQGKSAHLDLVHLEKILYVCLFHRICSTTTM